jgi:hypothetical protein
LFIHRLALPPLLNLQTGLCTFHVDVVSSLRVVTHSPYPVNLTHCRQAPRYNLVGGRRSWQPARSRRSQVPARLHALPCSASWLPAIRPLCSDPLHVIQGQEVFVRCSVRTVQRLSFPSRHTAGPGALVPSPLRTKENANLASIFNHPSDTLVPAYLEFNAQAAVTMLTPSLTTTPDQALSTTSIFYYF